MPLGVAEEEEKKSRKHQGGDAISASGHGGHESRDHNSNSYERPSGRVDAHQMRSASILPYPGGFRPADPPRASGCRRMMVASPLQGNLLHTVLEGQLPFLDGGFFDLFGL